jgi:mono/diheme cytochrome c family protein
MEGAPPFREFAAKWPLDALEEALADGIVTGHPEMPEFKLTPDQISAFIAYLETLGE